MSRKVRRHDDDQNQKGRRERAKSVPQHLRSTPCPDLAASVDPTQHVGNTATSVSGRGTACQVSTRGRERGGGMGTHRRTTRRGLACSSGDGAAGWNGYDQAPGIKKRS